MTVISAQSMVLEALNARSNSTETQVGEQGVDLTELKAEGEELKRDSEGMLFIITNSHSIVHRG